MKKRFLSLFILCSSFLIALALNKYFKLTLTLPLLTIGLGILFAQNILKGQKVLRLLAINIGILFSVISICFSIVNLKFLKLNSPKTPTKRSGDYTNSEIFLGKEDSDGLGYKYKPGLNNISSKIIALTQKNREIQIYDVIYNIDEIGNRFTPNKSKSSIDKNNAILFLGDSYTFGEGLNNDETLSYFFQKSTLRSTINTGMHGYGAHQALKILEDEKLYLNRTKGNEVKTVIYRFIVDHINRAAGYSPWDKFGPCYEIDQSGNIKYRGSFEDCGKRSDGILNKIMVKFAITSEPFTANLFRRFSLHGKYLSGEFHSSDIERFLLMTNKMEEITKRKGGRFFIIFEDAGLYDEFCGTKVRYSEKLSKLLKKQHKNVILTSDVYSENICLNNKLTISEYDRHPSKAANKILSDYLFNNDLIE